MGRPSRAAVYARFEAALEDLRSYGGLPRPHEARDLWTHLWHLEAHHSTAIEGNTLILKEVEKLLEDHRAVGSKELKDYMEVLGYGDAARWVYEQGMAEGDWQTGQLIAVSEVRNIHAGAMEKVWTVAPHPDANPHEGPGSFREHDIQAFRGGMQPPSHVLVAPELTGWVDEVCAFGEAVKSQTIAIRDIPPRIAMIHRNFEGIHPFIDGNGRTGRLVLNLILVRLGWPPAIIFKKDRQKYLRALDRADQGDPGPLAELISRSVINNLHALIPNIAGPAKYVPLQSLVDDRFTIEALKQAAVRGRLNAIQGRDGIWRSSQREVDEYARSRWKRSASAID